MAISPVNLTGNIGNLVGAITDPMRTKVWIDTNIDGDQIIDAAGKEIRLGNVKATVEADGRFTFTGLAATNSATQPTAWQYRVHIDYPVDLPQLTNGGKNKRWSSDWFSLTSSKDLSEVVGEVLTPPNYRSDFTAEMDAIRAEAEAAAAQARDISNIDTTDDAVDAALKLPDGKAAKTLSASTAAFAQRKAVREIDIREWTDQGGQFYAPGRTLYGSRNGNNHSLFTQVMTDLKARYDATGVVHVVLVPAGEYDFGSRLTPPDGGCIGIRGEGMDRTIFYTPSSVSWFGMNEGTVLDPDFSWSNFYFEDFTVDGELQPDGSLGYITGAKGFIAHNFRDSVFRRVRVRNTHATGIGCDHIDETWFIEVEAINNGRARRIDQPDPTTRFGSGSGIGLGFGHTLDAAVYIINSIARGNGASGFFFEHLARPESLYRSVGVVIANCLTEGNAIGLNDTGVRGIQVNGLVSRNNLYAGYRVGISNASVPGGTDGVVNGLVTYGNAVGVALEGNAGSYLFDNLEAFENDIGVEFRDTAGAWPGRQIRFRKPHLHDNGGPGLLASTKNPIVGLDVSDALVHDNGTDSAHPYRDGITILSPTSRAKITGRAYANPGYALAFRGGPRAERPVIDLDVHGSSGGGALLDATIDDTSKIVVTGNPSTVKQLTPRPVPDSAMTGWAGSQTDRTYAASYAGLDGADLGPHVIGAATGEFPRVVATAATVTPGQIVTISAYLIAPKGKLVRPTVRFGPATGGTYVAGPIERATGSRQRVAFTTVVPAGQTTALAGAMGSGTTMDPWSGQQIRVTQANVTVGGQPWPYIDGGQPNSAWDGTAGSSTSTLTIPNPGTVTPPGPVVIASDAFTGADAASLDGRTLDNSLGGTGSRTWTTPSTSQIGIQSGQVYRSGTGAIRQMLADFGLSGRFEVKVPVIGTGAVVLRGRNIDDSNHYRVSFAPDGAVILRRVVGGVSTDLLTTSGFSAGDRVALQVTGTGATATVSVYVNDVLVSAVTDNVPIASGTQWGIAVPNDTTVRLDDVKFYTV